MYLQCGYDDINISREFGSYVGMLKEIGELRTTELEAFEMYETLLIEVEKTAMNDPKEAVERIF